MTISPLPGLHQACSVVQPVPPASSSAQSVSSTKNVRNAAVAQAILDASDIAMKPPATRLRNRHGAVSRLRNQSMSRALAVLQVRSRRVHGIQRIEPSGRRFGPCRSMPAHDHINQNAHQQTTEKIAAVAMVATLCQSSDAVPSSGGAPGISGPSVGSTAFSGPTLFD